jgi:hypothetical protein
MPGVRCLFTSRSLVSGNSLHKLKATRCLGSDASSLQENLHPGVNTVPQNASTQMPFNSNVNVEPQGASYQVPPFGGLSGSAMYHPAPSSVTGPTNQGTLYQQPSPPVNVPTSPACSTDSDKSVKSRRSHKDDRLNDIFGTLLK